MKQIENARFMMAGSMVVFGTIGLFVRQIPVTSGELALYRAVMAAVLLGCYFVLTKQSIDLKKIRREFPADPCWSNYPMIRRPQENTRL